MQLEVLISCMNQKDTSIVQKSKVAGDVLIINQCEKEAQEQIYKGNQRIRMVSTKQRGLSNSRNLAIHLSDRDICLLCDDDEVFEEDYESIVLESFEKLMDADLIAFDVIHKETRDPEGRLVEEPEAILCTACFSPKEWNRRNVFF